MTTAGVDEDRVTSWLTAHVEGVAPPLTFERLAGGRSNITFRVTDAAGRRLVLRRPPLGPTPATAHDMAREHRIITAVGRTEVPVPPALALCLDDQVNGAPFYVMEFVDGRVLEDPASAADIVPANRPRLAEDLIDTLAELHSVDIDEVGLGDFARRDGHIERQLKRFSQQWQHAGTRPVPAIDEAERRLRAGVPPQQRTSIVHGDYRFGNCIVDVTAGRVAAVLDWELCTLGDPLADVAYLGMHWSEPDRPSEYDVTSIGGFPPFAQLLDRYRARTGLDCSDIAYYLAFSAWRGAIISDGVYARYQAGGMGDDDADVERFRVGVEQLAEAALDFLGDRR